VSLCLRGQGDGEVGGPQHVDALEQRLCHAAPSFVGGFAPEPRQVLQVGPRLSGRGSAAGLVDEQGLLLVEVGKDGLERRQILALREPKARPLALPPDAGNAQDVNRLRVQLGHDLRGQGC